jgi:hypothetical protein
LHSLTIEGQAATCPKCCVIKTFSSEKSSQIGYLLTQKATQAEVRLLQGAKEKYLQVLYCTWSKDQKRSNST